jgi:hypothetical protein
MRPNETPQRRFQDLYHKRDPLVLPHLSYQYTIQYTVLQHLSLTFALSIKIDVASYVIPNVPRVLAANRSRHVYLQ